MTYQSGLTTGISVVLLAAMLWAAPTKGDTLDITASFNGGPEYTWINVPIGYGLRQGDFHAGLGTYLDPNADGPTRGFWLNDLAGESLHVVVTDNGIGTSGYTSFQFPTNGMFQGQANGLQWNEQIVINGTPITSPDQIVDVGSGPYSISAIFDVSILPGSSGGSFFNQFVVSPTPISLPVNPVPGPVVGVGLPGLMAMGLLLLARWRKRRFAS